MHLSFKTTHVALVLVGALLGGFSITNAMDASNRLDAARTGFQSAISSVTDARASDRAQLDAARAIVDKAGDFVIANAALTGEHATLDALAARIVDADHVVDAAQTEVDRLVPPNTKSTLASRSTADVTTATLLLSHANLSALDQVSASVSAVLAAEGTVTTAVAAWNEHLRKVAAAKAAAEAAARAAAAQAAAQAAVAHAAGRAPARASVRTAAVASSGGFSLNVWTSGFQAQLDACRGAVNLTGSYGVATIGEKWNCGGSRFPAAGSIVKLTGVISGTFRVGGVVAVLSAYSNSTRDIPRGYQLLFQTCRGNNAHTETFTALTRVG
jgi:hypothetical protein